MWRTSEGLRVLRGAEWSVFRDGLGWLKNMAEETLSSGDRAPTGIAAYDALQPRQQLVLLAAVGTALSDESVAPPPLSELNEAVVAAVFEAIRDGVIAEVEMAPRDGPSEAVGSWRQAVRAACAGLEKPLPAVTSLDEATWNRLVDGLADRVLWDRDFEMANDFLDAEPEEASNRRACLGIEGDYFTAVPPDPTEADVESARATLWRLTAEPLS